jgi:hypothetical protein
MIERVENGWIVRPFEPCPEWACSQAGPRKLWVFRDMSDLLRALPDIIEGPERALPIANQIPNEPL